MSLPATDSAYLADIGLEPQISVEQNMTCVVFMGWALPPGYELESADLLLRLSPGYPDVPPDMWWFSPAVRLATGAVAPGTEVVETYFGRQWQRWSRHFQPGQWRTGIDGLESYLALIHRELLRCAAMAA